MVEDKLNEIMVLALEIKDAAKAENICDDMLESMVIDALSSGGIELSR